MLISHVHEWNIILVTRDTVLHACHLNETGSRGDNLLIKKKKFETPRNILYLFSPETKIFINIISLEWKQRKTNVYINENRNGGISPKRFLENFARKISIWNNLTNVMRYERNNERRRQSCSGKEKDPIG